MPRRSRIRRTIKWTGLIVCAVVLGAWAVSLRWDIVAWRTWTISVGRGRLFVHSFPWLGSSFFLYSPSGKSSWTYYRRPVTDCAWTERLGLNWNAKLEWSSASRAFAAPFWMLFGGAAALTGALYRLARPRPKHGFCDGCGYNLTGNASGRCPECGTLVHSVINEVRE